MKWKNWNLGQWVLESEDGEVLDQVKRDEISGLYYVQSTSKKYTTEKAAMKAAEKDKKEQSK